MSARRELYKLSLFIYVSKGTRIAMGGSRGRIKNKIPIFRPGKSNLASAYPPNKAVGKVIARVPSATIRLFLR